jgi:hypothetical protein
MIVYLIFQCYSNNLTKRLVLIDCRTFLSDPTVYFFLSLLLKADFSFNNLFYISAFSVSVLKPHSQQVSPIVSFVQHCDRHHALFH